MDTLMALAMLAKMKISNFLTDEEGEVNIVTIVVLIGVAVLLAIIFRGAIENLLKSLFGTVENNAKNAIN
ncbi:MAG: Flp1 family type IVb pilin [Lachnospiraceae bacterium]|nr:Flp1 family type IVb pilin [Lachnospiraceae bacterium]